MYRIALFATLVAASLVLVACGDSDHPRHAAAGPHGNVIMPDDSPSIHFQINDKQGNTMDLMIECGAETSLKQCAQVNQSILEQVGDMRAKGRNNGG
jgi:major membrane immunogen (membrane-anchored lipoprotein)